MVIDTIEKLEKVIGYQFKNRELLKQALTHSSFANEQRICKGMDYERIEFLGDAVLELVSSEFLYHLYDDMVEGEMTKLRASFVCEQALANCSRPIDLGKYLYLGKGEEATGGRSRESILADVMEGIIGAIYLDGGFESASKFIHQFILNDIEEKQLIYDSKTLLQEIIQSQGTDTLRYVCVKEEGPDHDKLFFIEAQIEGQVISVGQGKTKKAAEQQAAYAAIINIKNKK